jgi:3-oxoacyl-[acyl-carrier protein] reductase
MILHGKVAQVTGGGRGIGAATAKLLAARGARVAVNYLRNAKAVEGVVQEIQAAGGEDRALQADVRDPEQVARLVAGVLEGYGRLDILVSNAAVRSPLAPFAQMAWKDFAQPVGDELGAAFHLTQAVLLVMTRRQYGRLVDVGSEHANGPTLPGSIAHGTAKAALVTSVRYLAHELGPLGITANVVSPGRVATEARAAFLPPGFADRMTATIPLRRLARPDDVARVTTFFAGDDSGFMIGTCAAGRRRRRSRARRKRALPAGMAVHQESTGA